MKWLHSLKTLGEEIAFLVVLDAYPSDSPQPFEAIDQQHMLELLVQRLDDEAATSRFLSRPLTYSAIAEWLKQKGGFPRYRCIVSRKDAAESRAAHYHATAVCTRL
jgi:thioesterase domain-containing protein